MIVKNFLLFLLVIYFTKIERIILATGKENNKTGGFMKTKIIPLSLILFLLTFCTDSVNDPVQSSATLDGTSQQSTAKVGADISDTDLDLLAKSISIWMTDDAARQYVKDQIQSSKKVESILEATEFLNSSFKAKPVIETLEDIGTEVEKKHLKELIKKLKFGVVDIYLPVKEHRNNLSTQSNICVVPYSSTKEDQSTVLGYEIGGSKVTLQTNEAPQTPVLVVTLSEKNSNYDPMNANKLVSEPTNQTQSLTNNYYDIFWKAIYIKKDYESWLGGDMEIYIRYRYKTSSSSWSTWRNCQVLNDIEANVRKDANIQLVNNIHSSFSMEFEIWEFDGGLNGGDDFVAPNSGDPYWDRHRIGIDWGTWSPWIWASVQTITTYVWREGSQYEDIQLQDGPVNDTDYDVLTLHKELELPY